MSTFIAPVTRRLALASFALALAGAGAAEAGFYRTTYVLTTPYTGTGAQITQVVADWSTSRTSGAVQEGDLADWRISLINGADSTAYYVDSAIVSGGVQSIGGVGRTLSDLMFRFNLDTMSAGEFDNMLTGSALTAATGQAFNIYSYLNGFPPPYSPLGMWSNGNESTRQLPGYLSVTTVAVPAPGAVALLGLAGLAGRGRRRR
jgi:MYXO-CTERM domain-containing protein